MNSAGEPIEGTGFLAPVVLADKCVGCGQCIAMCRYDAATPNWNAAN